MLAIDYTHGYPGYEAWPFLYGKVTAVTQLREFRKLNSVAMPNTIQLRKIRKELMSMQTPVMFLHKFAIGGSFYHHCDSEKFKSLTFTTDDFKVTCEDCGEVFYGDGRKRAF